jgi:hypothetical protein
LEFRICVRCNLEETRETDQLEHDWGDWEVTTAATTAAEGVETRRCTLCDLEETRPISRLEATPNNPGTSGTPGTFGTPPASGATVIVTPPFVPLSPEPLPNPFVDIIAGSWYFDYVLSANFLGLMTGTSENEFDPTAPMTRAMVATVLYRKAGSPSVAGLENPFVDIVAGTWYTDAVIWAYANGVVMGMGDETFAPNQLITREQMAAMLYRYAQYDDYDTSTDDSETISAFSDAQSVSDFAVIPLQWANGNGIITGKPGGLLDPQGSAVRSEFAAVLVRLVELTA